MSEHQYVGFRAIDKPVSQDNLAFMRRQSSRAEITPRSFDNEYHYGDFRGDALEMLRRGYDIHLHYADFGIRKLLVRFSHGLARTAENEPYFIDDGLTYIKDKKGPGGILVAELGCEPGDLDVVYECNNLLDDLMPLRDEILNGDLRPLYLAHLGLSSGGEFDSEETKEAPVPAGLNKPTTAQRGLAEFFGIGPTLLAAAALRSPAMPATATRHEQLDVWVRSRPQAKKDQWLTLLVADSEAIVRADILAEYRKDRPGTGWPTVPGERTIVELRASADKIHRERQTKVAATAARERKKRLAAMLADPAAFVQESDKLVQERSRTSYAKAAAILADLREVLAGTNKSSLAAEQAQRLKSKYPTLRILTAELRQVGFLKK